MNIFGQGTGFTTLRLKKRVLGSLLSFALLFAIWPQDLPAHQDAPAQATQQAPPQDGQAPPYTTQTPEQIHNW